MNFLLEMIRVVLLHIFALKIMKKIVLVLTISLLITTVVFRGIDNPYKLSFSIQSLAYKSRLSRLAYNNFTNLIDKVPNIIPKDFGTKEVKAEVKRTVYYKGKKLEFYTKHPRSVMPENIMEALYEYQLEKEKGVQK